MKEKKYLILGISIILISIIGITFAYFSTSILGDRKKVSVDMAELKIIFTNGDAIEATNVSAEDNLDIVKTFSVENKTKYDYEYNIVIEELINTFKTKGFLVYKITSTDGGYNMADFVDVPKSSKATDTILANYITIPAKSIHNYTIEIKYINSESFNQNIDMGAQLKGKIFISKGYKSFANAILMDNPTVKTRNDFTKINSANTTGIIYKTTSDQVEDNYNVYYYSGNTQNNWLYLKSDPITTCSYENTEVIYYDLSSEKTKVITSEEMCISTNICKFTNESETMYVVGLTEESCTKDGGTWLNEKATFQATDINTYWRIIIMLDDVEYNSIYLLYAGTHPDTTEGYNGISKYNKLSNDPMYVGLSYGTSGTIESNRSEDKINYSDIIMSLSNFVSQFSWSKYVSTNSYFNFDRDVDNDIYSLTSSFNYATYTRMNNNKPMFKLGNSKDKISSSAFITADDVAFAGGVVGVDNPYAWYNTNCKGESVTNNKSWWTMSPKGYNPISEGSSTLGAFNYSVSGNGAITSNLVTDELAVRLAIAFLGDYTMVTGTGTIDDPYEIDFENSTIIERPML